MWIQTSGFPFKLIEVLWNITRTNALCSAQKRRGILHILYSFIFPHFCPHDCIKIESVNGVSTMCILLDERHRHDVDIVKTLHVKTLHNRCPLIIGSTTCFDGQHDLRLTFHRSTTQKLTYNSVHAQMSFNAIQISA